MIAAGVNAKALSTFMGHANIAVTLDKYGHLFPGSEAEAADLLNTYLARDANGSTSRRLSRRGRKRLRYAASTRCSTSDGQCVATRSGRQHRHPAPSVGARGMVVSVLVAAIAIISWLIIVNPAPPGVEPGGFKD